MASATLSVLSVPTASAAEDTKAQCLSAYENGQRARKAGAYSEAQRALAFCGGESCPQALHADCQRWLEEVETATPTSVFRVSDATTGERLSRVQLTIDGQHEQTLDGRALPFDPGEHSLVFQLPGYRPLKQRLTFSEGEKLVMRNVVLQPVAQAGGAPPSASSEASKVPSSGGTKLPIWIGAGVGALGAGGFAYYSLNARADDRALDACYPNCPQTQVDNVREQYRLAHIALGVGAAGVLVAGGWLLFGPKGGHDEADAKLRLYVGPTTWLVGRF